MTMKKILSMLIVLVLVLAAFAACGTPDETTIDNGDDTVVETPEEKAYSLALAVDTAFGKGGKVSNTAMVLVLDADNKIVAARVDCAEATPALDEEGALVAADNVLSKVEKGDAYTGMAAGSWADQAKAFENWLVGKTADEVAGTEFTNELIAGCTMTSSMATLKALVAKAYASEYKVAFTTAEDVTTGIALSTAVKSGRGGSITVSTDVAALAVADGKVVATAIDSIEQSFTVEEGALVAGELKASKADQGEAYTGMPAGPWYKQAQAYANSTVGVAVAELENIDTVSDALAAAGCTMQSTTAGYKATIIKAAGYAR